MHRIERLAIVSFGELNRTFLLAKFDESYGPVGSRISATRSCIVSEWIYVAHGNIPDHSQMRHAIFCGCDKGKKIRWRHPGGDGQHADHIPIGVCVLQHDATGIRDGRPLVRLDEFLPLEVAIDVNDSVGKIRSP